MKTTLFYITPYVSFTFEASNFYLSVYYYLFSVTFPDYYIIIVVVVVVVVVVFFFFFFLINFFFFFSFDSSNLLETL
jgi:hypothetical protein